jgi:hypothetical protein
VQKSRVFNFYFLTNVLGEDFSISQAGKIYLNLIGKMSEIAHKEDKKKITQT